MIQDLLKQRILILDGATGTAIQSYKLTEADFRGERFKSHPVNLKGNNDILSLTRPDIIKEIHQSYIDVGADILETNTFNANVVSQEKYQCKEFVYQMNVAGAQLAKQTALNAHRKIFVAGSIGPTSKTLSLSPDVSHPERRAIDFDTLASACEEQVKGLIDGGADILLVETVFDGLNAKAALYAISKVQKEKGTQLPVMVSATVNDLTGRTLTGQTLEALYTAVSHYPIISFGLNCSFGASDLYPFMKQLSKTVPCYLSIYPNAGFPDEMGQYDEKPEVTAHFIEKMAADGLVNIVGGCCGTTPEHIRQIKKAVEKLAPRVLPQTSSKLILSGLDTVVVDKVQTNFINIGERTNVAGSAVFAKLIREKNYEEAAAVARKQIESHALRIPLPCHSCRIGLGANYSVQLTSTGSTPIEYTMVSGQLPNGLSLNQDTGQITGVPNTAGVFYFTIVASNIVGNSDPVQFQIETGLALAITTTSILRVGTLNVPYSPSITFQAEGLDYSQAPVMTWSWSAQAGSSLPPGLTLNGSTGILSGTPTQIGTFNFNVTVVNGPSSATSPFTIIIGIPPIITISNNMNGKSGKSLALPLQATSDVPIIWSFLNDFVPHTDINLSDDGLLTWGCPLKGEYLFSVVATNIFGNSIPLTIKLTITGMYTFFNGKKIKHLFFKGKEIKSAYVGGTKIYESD